MTEQEKTAEAGAIPVMMNLPPKADKKRVVIVGGGFGGLKLARTLKDDAFQVVLLDKSNHHIFQPLLYQVTAAAIQPSSVSFPFRKVFHGRKNLAYRMCTALKVDSANKILYTTIGAVEYDYLVLAQGVDTNYFGDPNLAETTMGLKTTSEALFNRNHVLKSLEYAENCHNAEEREAFLTFVVVGGGATGVELAGALAEMRKFILPRDYPDMDIEQMRIVLVTGGKRILPSFTERSSAEAAEYLIKRKVELMMSVRVLGYENGVLTLQNGKIKTQNVFWAAGVIAHPIEGIPQESIGRGNRLLVDEFNQVNGMEDVFCIGDAALMKTVVYPDGHPQVAQPALQQAANVAYNLKQVSLGQGMRPFSYHDRGSMATIGRHHAVVETKHLIFGGFFGWIVWLIIHLMALVGVQNKIVLFIDWCWSYLTYDSPLRIIIQPVFRKNLLESPDVMPKKSGAPKAEETVAAPKAADDKKAS